MLSALMVSRALVVAALRRATLADSLSVSTVCISDSHVAWTTSWESSEGTVPSALRTAASCWLIDSAAAVSSSAASAASTPSTASVVAAEQLATAVGVDLRALEPERLGVRDRADDAELGGERHDEVGRMVQLLGALRDQGGRVGLGASVPHIAPREDLECDHRHQHHQQDAEAERARTEPADAWGRLCYPIHVVNLPSCRRSARHSVATRPQR